MLPLLVTLLSCPAELAKEQQLEEPRHLPSGPSLGSKPETPLRQRCMEARGRASPNNTGGQPLHMDGLPPPRPAVLLSMLERAARSTQKSSPQNLALTWLQDFWELRLSQRPGHRKQGMLLLASVRNVRFLLMG